MSLYFDINYMSAQKVFIPSLNQTRKLRGKCFKLERHIERSKILVEVRQIIGLVKAGLPSTQTTLLLYVGTTLVWIEYTPVRIKYNYIMEQS